MVAGRSDDDAAVLVRILAGCGVSQDRIGEVVGVSDVTLAKRFPKELKTGPSFVLAAVLQALFAKAQAGDVAACVALLARVPPGKGHRPQAVPVVPSLDQLPKGVGKKQAQQAIAHVAQAGTEWEGLLHDGDPVDDGEDEPGAGEARRPRGRPRKTAA